jgi:hypothetical protein
MTEKKAAIGDKENSPAASSRPKHRSRRVEGELRQRLLKQNFEQQHFKSSLVSGDKELKEVATSNNNPPQPPNNSAVGDQKQHPVRISCEEKVKQIRHKLEKIVHKREPNESKAIGYLSTLDSMRLTPQVVANTRVDLVIEALVGMAKDSAVVAKAKDSLARLKAVMEVMEKVTIKDTLQYRDPAEEAKKKARKEEAERRRNSPKKYTATSSLLSLVGSEQSGNVVGEAGESSVGHLPSMRGLDYWMNKMVSDMAKLDVLGQQVGRIEKVVEIEAKQKQQQEQQEQKGVGTEAKQKQQQQQQKQKEVDMESKQKQQQLQEQKAVEPKQKQQQEKQKEVEMESKQKQQQQQGQKAVESKQKQQQQGPKMAEMEAKQKQQQKQKEVDMESKQQQQKQKEVDMESKQKQQQQQQKVLEKSRKELEGSRRNGDKGGERLMAGKGGSKLEEDLLQITATVGRIAIREETEKIPSVKAR